MFFETTRFYFFSIFACSLASLEACSCSFFYCYRSTFSNLAFCLMLCSCSARPSALKKPKTFRSSTISLNLISTRLSMAILSPTLSSRFTWLTLTSWFTESLIDFISSRVAPYACRC